MIQLRTHCPEPCEPLITVAIVASFAGAGPAMAAEAIATQPEQLTLAETQ